jgi:excisionase family DNA binding protein
VATLTETASTPRRLIDAREAGRLLGCSWRTIYRLSDAGKIPAGLKLGALRRWDAAELDAFIANGCKPPKSSARGRA